MNCTKIILLSLIVGLFPFMSFAQEMPVYQDISKPVEERVEDALSRMTLREKVSLVHADRSYGAAGVPRRLGILTWGIFSGKAMAKRRCTARRI